jgi:Flp pilus assembly protein TadB
MNPFFTGILLGSITTLFLLVGCTLALSFGSSSFASASLSGLLCAALLVWLGGAVLMWKSFQYSGQKRFSQQLTEVGWALLWPVGVAAIVAKLLYDAGFQDD